MFFPRLRRQAKWAFAGMVVVFALAFVVAGVGSGSGIGDLLQGRFGGLFGGGGSSGPSISKAQDRVHKHPKSATAWHDLAVAYEAKHRNAGAIGALKREVALRPKDKAVYSELASLQLARATALSEQANALYQSEQAANPGQQFAPSPTSKIGQALGTDPITQALTGGSTNFASVYAQQQSAVRDAVSTYKRLATVDPTDAGTQQELGLLAENAGDASTAIAAYQRFLKLAPNDPSAAQIKAKIKQLKAQRATRVTSSGG
jgi:tetratricopeptide (TPR) repeat protein